MDSEILQATVDKQQFAVRLTAETPAIARLLSSFHAGLEEVTILALPEGSHRPVHVNSFIDPQKGVCVGGGPRRGGGGGGGGIRRRLHPPSRAQRGPLPHG